MGFTVASENLAVNGVTGGASGNNKWISLHTADPGDTGASEVTGGTYAREATTWGNASASAATGSAVTSDVPAGTTITHWGLWTAASGGSFLYGGPLAAPESFGSNGTYSLTPTISASD